MSQPEKPTKSRKKPMADIDKPGKSAPSSTSKPVIITNRPLLKDPMVVDKDAKTIEEHIEDKKLNHSAEPALQPLSEPDKAGADPPVGETSGEDDKSEAVAPEPRNRPANDETPAPTAEPADDKKEAGKTKQKADAEAAEHAKHDAIIQKLIDSKKYELPINAVEKRKTKRFVVLGVLLAIVLALAWADIAADAGLIHVNGVKPVTHFFSN